MRRKFIPILEWLPNYNKSLLKGDLIAGLTVGVMLIPQGMAYAMLAGMPPIYGLYASILPLILYAIFGTSRQLAVGPVAMVSLLIAAGVGTIAESGSAEYIQLVILLALMVGIIQLLLGIFRLGFLVNFLSHPVISGFTSAAALIIGFSQLKNLLGIKIPRSSHIFTILYDSLSNIGQTNIPTFIVGSIGIAIIMAIKKWGKGIPGSLVVVLFGILAVYFFDLSNKGMSIVGQVPEGLPIPSLPVFSVAHVKALLPIALTISFIGFLQSMAVAKAIQAKHRNYKIVPDQELIALGIANIGASFFQAFPTTGGFSRTAVNDGAGAKTGMAAIFSALLIVLTLLFLTPLFYYLPNAVLASIIMVAVFGLVDFKEAIYLWKKYRSDFWMLAATFVGTLILGIEEGVLLGVLLSMGMVIYQTTQPHIAVLGKIPNGDFYRNISRFKNLEIRKDVLIVRFDARLYYANVSYFSNELEKRIRRKGKDLKLFILDADCINGIDSTGVRAFEDLIIHCQKAGIQFSMVNIKGPVRDVFYRYDLFKKIGEERFFMQIQHAIDAYDKQFKFQFRAYTFQTNEKEDYEDKNTRQLDTTPPESA